MFPQWNAIASSECSHRSHSGHFVIGRAGSQRSGAEQAARSTNNVRCRSTFRSALCDCRFRRGVRRPGHGPARTARPSAAAEAFEARHPDSLPVVRPAVARATRGPSARAPRRTSRAVLLSRQRADPAADVPASAWASAARSAAPRPCANAVRSAERNVSSGRLASSVSTALGRVGHVDQPLPAPPGCPAAAGPGHSAIDRLQAGAHLLRHPRVRQQPLARRRRRVVALAHLRPVARLLRQLERGLEEVHEQPHRRGTARPAPPRPPALRAAGSRRSAAPPRRSSARRRPGRSCGRAGSA